MKIRLAHHYWNKRENSVWNPVSFPYPEIEQEVKQSYALLEDERPKWRRYGDLMVFFDYRPGQDIFGRDIVPISFAFVPGCIDPDTCWQTLAKKLASAPVSSLELDVNFPPGSIAKPKKKGRWGLFGLAGALIVCIAWWGLAGSGKEEHPVEKTERAESKAGSRLATRVDPEMQTQKAAINSPGEMKPTDRKMAIPGERKFGELETTAGNKPESGSQKGHSESAGVHPAKQPELDSSREWICAHPTQLFEGANPDCPAEYVSLICQGQIPSGIGFEAWARSGVYAKCARNRNWNPAAKLSSEIKRELERIKRNGHKS